MRVRMVVVSCLLGACACAPEAEPALPPVTPEASYPLFASEEPVAAPGPSGGGGDGRRARLVLQRILRGAGAGRPVVCGWVDPGHAEERFGAPCPRWVKGLTPQDRAKLRKVKVPSAAPGDGAREWIVDSADLVWPAGEPEALPAAPYVMRLKGKRWTLSG